MTTPVTPVTSGYWAPGGMRPLTGAFVIIPFGAKGTQVAYVTGYTSAGNIKVRAWNAAQRKWTANLRTMNPDHILGSGLMRARGLPTPPKS